MTRYECAECEAISASGYPGGSRCVCDQDNGWIYGHLTDTSQRYLDENPTAKHILNIEPEWPVIPVQRASYFERAGDE